MYAPSVTWIVRFVKVAPKKIMEQIDEEAAVLGACLQSSGAWRGMMDTKVRRVEICADDSISYDDNGGYIILDIENYKALTHAAADGKIAAVGYDEIRARLVIMFKLDARCSWAWDRACKMRDPNKDADGTD